MSVKIDDFKAAFDTGFARSNRYEVLIPMGDNKLKLMCDSVTWPGRQLLTSERYTSMKAQKMPYAFAHEDSSISFILDNDWYPWSFIHDWQSRVINGIGSLRQYEVNYQNEYARDISITHRDTEDRIRKHVILKKAFPTTLNSIELGNGNDNEIIRVNAEFSYQNWEDVI